MNLGDLLGNPLKLLTAPFDKREGMTWMQSTARNLNDATVGKYLGAKMDQTFLGDAPPQGPTSQSMQSQQLPMGGVPGGSLKTNPMLSLVQQWMQNKGQ